MAEYDKERVLEGNTVDDQDGSKIQAVITNLGQYRRQHPRPPSEPVGFEDKQSPSELVTSVTRDDNVITDYESKIVDIHSRVGLEAVANRARTRLRKKAV